MIFGLRKSSTMTVFLGGGGGILLPLLLVQEQEEDLFYNFNDRFFRVSWRKRRDWLEDRSWCRLRSFCFTGFLGTAAFFSAAASSFFCFSLPSCIASASWVFFMLNFMFLAKAYNLLSLTSSKIRSAICGLIPGILDNSVELALSTFFGVS